jgi:hypothetical protein
MLPLKDFTSVSATNEKTVVLPFGPLYRFHLMPAIFVEATGVALPSEPYVPRHRSRSVNGAIQCLTSVKYLRSDPLLPMLLAKS